MPEYRRSVPPPRAMQIYESTTESEESEDLVPLPLRPTAPMAYQPASAALAVERMAREVGWLYTPATQTQPSPQPHPSQPPSGQYGGYQNQDYANDSQQQYYTNNNNYYDNYRPTLPSEPQSGGAGQSDQGMVVQPGSEIENLRHASGSFAGNLSHQVATMMRTAAPFTSFVAAAMARGDNGGPRPNIQFIQRKPTQKLMDEGTQQQSQTQPNQTYRDYPMYDQHPNQPSSYQQSQQLQYTQYGGQGPEVGYGDVDVPRQQPKTWTGRDPSTRNSFVESFMGTQRTPDHAYLGMMSMAGRFAPDPSGVQGLRERVQQAQQESAARQQAQGPVWRPASQHDGLDPLVFSRGVKGLNICFASTSSDPVHFGPTEPQGVDGYYHDDDFDAPPQIEEDEYY